MLQMSKNAIRILKFIVEVISFYNKYDDQKDNDWNHKPRKSTG